MATPIERYCRVDYFPIVEIRAPGIALEEMAMIGSFSPRTFFPVIFPVILVSVASCRRL
jgi:hypothetical protein